MTEQTKVCPICFSNDLVDFNTRPKARCQNCGSMERGRLAWIVLARLGCLQPGTKFLNFAPEPFMLTIGQRIIGDNYQGADFAPELFRDHASSLIKLDMCKDLETLGQDTYDVIMHNHVLEHLPCDVTETLLRLNAILRPGGWHIFSIPIFANRASEEDLSPYLSPDERTRRFGQNDHMRVFGRDFHKPFRNAGMIDGLYDLRQIITEDELVKLSIPSSALSEPSPHRVFAWKKPAQRP